MYKVAQDKLDSINRVASHATKPRANGRIDEIPTWAAEPEAYFNSLKDRFEILSKQRDNLKERLSLVKFRLSTRLPYAEFEKLKSEREILVPQIIKIEEEAASYRSLTRAAAINAWGAVYYYCANKVLDGKTKDLLEKEVTEILNRSPSDGIGKPETNKSAVEKRRVMKKKNFQRDLKYIRLKNGRGDPLIYTTETGYIYHKDRK